MECPDPSLKLFFSVDIIDSTSFKHSHLKDSYLSSHWIEDFKEFYDDFPTSLQKAYEKLDDQSSIEEDEFVYPYIWKYLGDEIVFVVEIKKFKYLVQHIDALKKAVSIRNNKSSKTLKIKATAWLAGFPVVNAILGDYQPNEDKEISKKMEFDFIGPSIDLGFRIAKYSTYRKLILSIDLALILLKLTITDKPYHFYFDKHKQTKGIHNDNYPIVWIDNLNGQAPLEDELYGLVRKHSNYEQLIQYISDYIQNDIIYKLMPPFLSDDTSLIDFKPNNYDIDYDTVCATPREKDIGPIDNKETNSQENDIKIILEKLDSLIYG